MALEIRWSTKADITLDHLIIYLELEWGDKVVKAFMKKLYDFLDIVAEYPEIGAMQYSDRGIRGFTLSKHNSIFYKVDEIK
ncbi:type II toxin-antitoxin system RelE/ParE family toxin [Bacteroidota bacterium]